MLKLLVLLVMWIHKQQMNSVQKFFVN